MLSLREQRCDNCCESCEDILQKDCGPVAHSNQTACYKCLATKAQAFAAGGCKPTEVAQFCAHARPPPPPSAHCKSGLFQDCGKALNSSKAECLGCVAAEATNLTKVAGCHAADLALFCSKAPPGPPPPPPPSPQCASILEKDCGAERSDVPKCLQCIATEAKNLAAGGCNLADLPLFCLQPPPLAQPPPPPPPKPASGYVETRGGIKWCSGGGPGGNYDYTPPANVFNTSLDGLCPLVPAGWDAAHAASQAEAVCTAAGRSCAGFTLYMHGKTQIPREACFRTDCSSKPASPGSTTRCFVKWQDPPPFTPKCDQLGPRSRIALAADKNVAPESVERFRQWVDTNLYPPRHLITSSLPSHYSKHYHGDGGSCCSYRPALVPGFANFTARTGELPARPAPNVYTVSELDAYLVSDDYGNNDANPKISLAIVFHSIPVDGSPGAVGHWDYSIRQNFTNGDVPATSVPPVDHLQHKLRMNEASKYLQNGFAATQLFLDRYIINTRAANSSTEPTNSTNHAILDDNGYGEVVRSAEDFCRNQRGASASDFCKGINAMAEGLAAPFKYVPQRVDTVAFPIAGFEEDIFYTLVKDVFAVFFVIVFLFTQKKVLNELIQEKEGKVRESLRMMGVDNVALIGSWYIVYAVIFAVLCGIFVACASLRVFSHSAPSLLWFYFWLWCMSFVSFAFTIQTFFDKSKTGGIIGMLIMFGQWVVYAGVTSQASPSAGMQTFLMLLPNYAFCAGVDMLAEFEQGSEGAQWSNLGVDIDNTTMSLVLSMLLCDCVLYTVLGWYLEQIMPKEFGVVQPPWFPFVKSYWTGKSGKTASAAEAVAASGGGFTTELMEDVSGALKSQEGAGTCVQLIKLRKEFTGPAGTKTAVSDLSLTMYEGQIFALLGHNGVSWSPALTPSRSSTVPHAFLYHCSGAGKTTTIGMLTGMVAPTSGKAYVYGKEINDEMVEIRHELGVCPQHDVLWLELTVAEHLTIFARLRSIPAGRIGAEIESKLAEVGLTEKRFTKAGELSGGQKRKLSLCLALVGDSKVIFLDEPTSGMDPYSRRSTWNMLQSSREGKTMILTTHFMDEADLLGDRIAIMAEGQLQCCGSSLYLKNQYGTGYHLTLTTQRGQTVGSAPVLSLINKHVPDAKLITDVGSEISLQLPTEDSVKFPAMFNELDASLASLKLEEYGISQVTLEEVFLKVASGAGGKDHTGGATGELAFMADASTRGNNGEASIFARHFGALVRKRLHYGRRDYKSICCVSILPVVLLVGGLLLLKYAGNPAQPDLVLGAAVFGEDPLPLPYFVVPGAAPGITSGLASFKTGGVGVSAVPVHVDLKPSNQSKFGVQYISGVPCEVSCANPLDHRRLSIPITCDVLMNSFSNAQTSGIDLGCTTDASTCTSSLANACANGGANCIRSCIDKGGGNTNRQVCKSGCDYVCQNIGPGMPLNPCKVYSYFNTTNLTDPKTKDLCPMSCNNCPKGSPCDPDDLDIPRGEPAAILQMSQVLWEQGALTDRTNARYGALIFEARTSAAEVGVTVLHNTTSRHGVPTYQNLVDSYLMQHFRGASSMITTRSHPLPVSNFLGELINSAVALASTLFILIAFSFVPAAVVAYGEFCNGPSLPEKLSADACLRAVLLRVARAFRSRQGTRGAPQLQAPAADLRRLHRRLLACKLCLGHRRLHRPRHCLHRRHQAHGDHVLHRHTPGLPGARHALRGLRVGDYALHILAELHVAQPHQGAALVPVAQPAERAGASDRLGRHERHRLDQGHQRGPHVGLPSFPGLLLRPRPLPDRNQLADRDGDGRAARQHRRLRLGHLRLRRALPLHLRAGLLPAHRHRRHRAQLPRLRGPRPQGSRHRRRCIRRGRRRHAGDAARRERACGPGHRPAAGAAQGLPREQRRRQAQGRRAQPLLRHPDGRVLRFPRHQR
jgi:ABC-type multidrug transport system ATPase subunit